MPYAMNPEILHRRQFTSYRVICKFCRTAWPCQVARQHQTDARLVADPWWYIGSKRQPEREKAE